MADGAVATARKLEEISVEDRARSPQDRLTPGA